MLLNNNYNEIARVSIIITSYNYGKYLPYAIDSALHQTIQDCEIVVIDDGSTDNTNEVVQHYISDSRVKYIYQENAGQPKAKNRGIMESSGDFIAFLDADDIWMPSKLEQQIPLFDDPDVGVVYSRRKWIDPDGNEIPGNERILQRGNILDQIFVDNFICFSSSIIRRSILDEVGYFDENIPMGIDYDLWIRLAARCRFDFIDAPLVKYRTGHANLSKNVMRRYECAHRIMDKAMNNPEIRTKMSWWVPRLAWADTWTNMAYYTRKKGDFTGAASYYLKSAASFPFHARTWKGLLCCLIQRA